MANISVSLPADGETIDAADYNSPITTIVNEINGELDNSNIASDAAIAGTKLASSALFDREVNDTSGNEVLQFASTASAVNELTITNAATGNAPSIAATGGDTNIALNLASKGTSPVTANGNPLVQNLAAVSITGNVTVSAGSVSQLTGLTTGSITVPTTASKVRVRATLPFLSAASASVFLVSIWEGTVGSGTQYQESRIKLVDSSDNNFMVVEVTFTAVSGTKTFNIGAYKSGGNVTVNASSTAPAQMTVECW